MIIRHPIRNARRYRQILSVLVKYGFSSFLHETGLASLRHHDHRPPDGPMPKQDDVANTRAQRLREAMEELGPTFIKLGQVLSTRPDLVPPQWTEEFKNLQSDCPKVPFEEIRKRLEQEFPGRVDEIYASIDPEPLAAASMAQAHAATLADGSDVVIKVLRPGVHDMIESDMETLHFIASIVEEHFTNLGFSPLAVVKEFAEDLALETDLMHEARSTQHLSRIFADNEHVGFPAVYMQATTKNVLTLERIHGILLSNLKPGDASQEARRKAVENGTDAVLKMCLQVGFFHADPHPGNIFMLENGDIRFIDCGMTGQVDDDTRYHIAELVYGVSKSDSEEVLNAAMAIGDIDTTKIDMRAVKRDIKVMVDQFVDNSLEEIDLTEVLNKFFDTLRKYHVQVPADLVLMIKAVSTIEGVALMVDPNFQMVDYAKPYVAMLIKERYSAKAIAKRFKWSAQSYIRMLEKLPEHVNDISQRLRRGDFRMNMELGGIDRLISTVHDATRGISFALLIASLVMASAILVLAARGQDSRLLHYLGTFGFIFSAGCALLLLYSGWRTSRALRKKRRSVN